MTLSYVTVYPASFDLPDEQWQSVNLLVKYMQDGLADMAIALKCYQQARESIAHDRDRDVARSKEEALAQGQRQSDFEREVAAKHGILRRDEMDALERDERRKAAVALDIAVVQERAALGHVPIEFIHRAPHAHALSFLGAADRFRKCLKALAALRAEIKPVYDAFATEFRGLKGVRDSAQHIDDRAQWLGRDNRGRKKPLDIGALSLENLDGDELISTDERGKLASFSVSSDVIRRFGEILQAAIDALPARGGRRTVRPMFGPFPWR
ncbi:hypothetical protein [Paraburkholderia sp. BL21I4N1]|uniref:hypothetical protein n=1 Tax=Paraburkholderia sp. BL21I4N1 TaxID=1938801 RepID=UPI000CFCD81C|nr:hypothetical protein [Paraburkholderia sp. BL21I4N1]PQV51806.1 hypothetical protein B0G83_10413 [Paraburkholderia sp. BL21I4N1]